MNSDITISFPSAAECYSAKRTHHSVNFHCEAPQARTVNLAGDFNEWDFTATPMRRMPDGRWTATLELHHGHHQYVFIVDGIATLDPNSHGTTRKEHNERVSLVAVS